MYKRENNGLLKTIGECTCGVPMRAISTSSGLLQHGDVDSQPEFKLATVFYLPLKASTEVSPSYRGWNYWEQYPLADIQLIVMLGCSWKHYSNYEGPYMKLCRNLKTLTHQMNQKEART